MRGCTRCHIGHVPAVTSLHCIVHKAKVTSCLLDDLHLEQSFYNNGREVNTQ